MRFFMVDRITEIEKGRMAVGVKNLSMNEDFFEHHFTSFPVMPGVLMIEAMVQLASWLIAFSNDFGVFAVLQSVKEAKFRKPLHPGDSLRVQVKSCVKDGTVFNGQLTLGNKLMASACFEVRLLNADEGEELFLTRQYRFLTTRL